MPGFNLSYIFVWIFMIWFQQISPCKLNWVMSFYIFCSWNQISLLLNALYYGWEFNISQFHSNCLLVIRCLWSCIWLTVSWMSSLVILIDIFFMELDQPSFKWALLWMEIYFSSQLKGACFLLTNVISSIKYVFFCLLKSYCLSTDVGY